MNIKLGFETPRSWTECVLADFNKFLLDHAAAEKKASSMAMTMVAHYPDRTELVRAMVDLALEELTHFRAVVKLLMERNLIMGADEKDPYVNAVRKLMRQGRDAYLLDRLLIAGIIEARGAERFGLVAAALEDESLKRFYVSITRSEQNHHQLFIDLAKLYFPEDTIAPRLEELLESEADIVANLPIRAALH